MIYSKKFSTASKKLIILKNSRMKLYPLLKHKLRKNFLPENFCRNETSPLHFYSTRKRVFRYLISTAVFPHLYFISFFFSLVIIFWFVYQHYSSSQGAATFRTTTLGVTTFSVMALSATKLSINSTPYSGIQHNSTEHTDSQHTDTQTIDTQHTDTAY